MSVEGEHLTFDEEVPATHDVDVQSVDWEQLFTMHAGSDGLLDLSTRTDAVCAFVPGIENARQADALLVEAAKAGLIDERHGDYYLETSVDISRLEIDWRELYQEVAGGVDQPLPSSTFPRRIEVKEHLGLADEQQAADVIEHGREIGQITLTDLGSGDRLYLSSFVDGDLTPATETDTVDKPEPEPEPETKTRPELEALQQQSSSVEEYASNLEGLLTDVLDRLEAVEQRQENQEQRANKFFEITRNQRVGLTEIQIERLQEGKVISRDGVDPEALENEFGDNLLVVGENNNHVRLENPDTDATKGATELPDFNQYCELESDLLKLNYKVKSKDELLNEQGGKKKYRALVVWRNKFIYGTKQGDRLHIPGKKIRQAILEHAPFGVDETGVGTTTNRVMDKFEEWTDGALKKVKDDSGRSCLQGRVDDIENECCQQFRSTEVDDDGTEVISPVTPGRFS